MADLASTLPANEARTNFYQLLDEVGDNLRRFVITHRGKTRAVVMPIEEVEAWEETLEILSDKKLMTGLKKAGEDIKKGRVISFDELKKKYDLQ